MRKKMMARLLKIYMRTFPPFDKNGNGILGTMKRNVLAFIMNVVGGRKAETMINDILTGFALTHRI